MNKKTVHKQLNNHKRMGILQMKSKILITLLACLLFSFSLASGQSFTLESVDGTTGLGNLQTGVPITFNIRMTGDASRHTGITNGFQVYSPDGAVWGSTTGDTLVTGLKSYFDLVFAINTFSTDGAGADTIGFGGASLFAPGLPIGYDQVAYGVTIGPIAESELGKTIVFDSSFYRPTGVWKWAGTEAFPSWDGPHSFTIGDVVSNTPPVLAAIGPQSVDEGGNLDINVSATDGDGDPLTITGLPVLTNASFVDNGDGTATYTFNPDFTQSGSYDVTFEVSDGSDTDSEVVTITVNDANQAPVLAAIADTTIEENQNVIINVSATDPDGTTPALSTSALPGTANFTDNGNGTGSFDWTTTFADAGSYEVTFLAGDGLGGVDSQIVTITVTNVNQAPTLDAVANQTVDEGVLLSFTITGSDPDGDAVTFGAFDAPAGMTVGTDGSVQFTPGFSQAGVYNVNYYATDGPDSAFQVATVTVNDINQAPVLADVDPQFVTAGEMLTFGVSAFDPDSTIPALSAENLPGSSTFDDNGDGTGTFMWSTLVSDNGTFDVTFIATDGSLTDTIIVSVTIGEAPITISATPDSLVFTFFTGDIGADTAVIAVTAANGDATIEAFESAAWMDVGAYTPALAPVDIKVAAYTNGLPAGLYVDTIVITAAEATNTETIFVYMYITDEPNNPPVVVAPVDTVFNTDECTPITINIEATDADSDELFLNVSNMVENMTFTDNGDGTGEFYFAPNFSQADSYILNYFATDLEDTTYGFFWIHVEDCEPGTEGDTVTVATVAAVPGARVVVPVDFANLCTLWEYEASLSFNSQYITLDSISYIDSRVTLQVNLDNFDNDTGFVNLHSVWAEADRQAPGSGNLANLHFSLAVGIPAGFYPLNTYMEPSYDRDCGGGNESVRPFFIPGGIVVDTSGNYVCGYVVDPEGNPIPGATVELWDDFPGGASEMMQDASGSGVFSFADFTTIPFDLYAYHPGYYPGSVENINFAQSGIMIVLEPVTPIAAVTNTWVDFYCGTNTFKGYPIPVGSVVEAFDPDGVKCGEFTVSTAGEYGFLHVYGDDDFAAGDQGAQPGDVIRLYVNGIEATTSITPTWTEDRDVIEVCLEVADVTPHSCMLSEGWNLVSWNVDTDVDDIMTVLESIESCLDVVMGFEQGALTFDASLPQFSDLWSVDHLSGYWVKVTCDVELTVMGTPVPETTPIPVTEGWNLVSYLPANALPTATALSSIHNDLIVALGYDAGSGLTYVPSQGEFNDLDELMSCFGYWVKVSQNGMLIYPSGSDSAPAFKADDMLASSLSKSELTPTTSWMNIYAQNLSVDGSQVVKGTEIRAYNENDALVGLYTMEENGKFGFMPIYGDDIQTQTVDGMKSGEKFYLTVDGIKTNERFTWNGSASKQEIISLSAKGTEDNLPTSFGLSQNYPNPFNPTTTISFSLPQAGNAQLEVFNLLGQKIKTIFDGQADAGLNTVTWDGTNNSGQTVASGIYFYRLTADNYSDTKKMTLLK